MRFFHGFLYKAMKRLPKFTRTLQAEPKEHGQQNEPSESEIEDSLSGAGKSSRRAQRDWVNVEYERLLREQEEQKQQAELEASEYEKPRLSHETIMQILRARNASELPHDLSVAYRWQKVEMNKFKEGPFRDEEPDLWSYTSKREFDNAWLDWDWRKTLHDRNLNVKYHTYLKRIINQWGVRMIMSVPNLPPLAEAYNDKKETYHDDKPKPLLMIKLNPTLGTVELSNRKTKPSDVDYHISLAFTNEIYRLNVKDMQDGIEQGKQAYMDLHRALHNKPVLLLGKAGQKFYFDITHAYILNDTGTDVVDILKEFKQIEWLHNCGRYHDRPIHISM